MVISTIAAIALAAYVIEEASVALINWLFKKSIKPEWLEDVPLSDGDKELIQKNRELLDSLVNNHDIVGTIQELSLDDRVQLMVKIVEGAKENYQIDLSSVKFAPSSEIGEYTLGYYSCESNGIVINLDYVASDSPEALKSIVKTIFHELRHAQQRRAVTDSDYNFGTEEQRQHWAMNFVNYIESEVDYESYAAQTIERDARAVAEAVTGDF